MTNNSAAKPLIPAGPDLQSQASTLSHDSIVWIESHWLNIAIAAGIAVAIVLALHAVRAWAMRLCQRGSGTATWYAVVGRALAKTGNFFIIMTALRLVSGYANPPQIVATTVGFLFTLAAVFQAAIWVRELIFGAIEHRTTSESYHGEGLASAIGIIRLLVSIVLFAIATVTVLSNVGVNVTGLVAGLGIGGIAIGLAAQGIFGDLIAALSIIFDRPFRVGQHIKYDSSDGTIEQIGLKSTRLRSVTGELRIISNRQLLDKEIQNHSDRRLIRFNWMLGVAYETPPETLNRLPQILKEIAEACGARAARNGFANFGASTLDYEFIVELDGSDWTAANQIRDKIVTEVLTRFAVEKINLPYPTQTTFTAAPDGTLILPYPEEPVELSVEKHTDADEPRKD